MSLALSGLISGASNISRSCSMSSMMRSTSISQSCRRKRGAVNPKRQLERNPRGVQMPPTLLLVQDDAVNGSNGRVWPFEKLGQRTDNFCGPFVFGIAAVSPDNSQLRRPACNLLQVKRLASGRRQRSPVGRRFGPRQYRYERAVPSHTGSRVHKLADGTHRHKALFRIRVRPSHDSRARESPSPATARRWRLDQQSRMDNLFWVLFCCFCDLYAMRIWSEQASRKIYPLRQRH